MPLGCGEDDSQDADELKDGAQEQPVAQHALEEGGLRDLRGGQVQIGRHGAAVGREINVNTKLRGETSAEYISLH